MDSSRSLNVFTCANAKYEDFAPIFIASCLWSNPATVVEIGVENIHAFRIKHGPALSVLSDNYGSAAFLIRPADWVTPKGRRILPNSVRFLTTPEIKSEYVYIGDIDIITLQKDIRSIHLAHMARTGLPFSNSVRPGTRRLTGLHFTRFDAQYPLAPHDDLVGVRISDEMLLYRLVERKHGPIPETPFFRPVHGIHVSPNRASAGDVRKGRRGPGWGIVRHRAKWIEFRATDAFRQLERYLSDRIRAIVAEIDRVALSQANGT
jgi:hypothetical protein